MNTNTPIATKNAVQAVRIARKYRHESSHHDGVVIIHPNEVGGWMNELRNPEHWVPGCIAVDNDNRCWLAVGGNDYNGAARWQAITYPQTPSPSIPQADTAQTHLPESRIDAVRNARVTAQLRRLKARQEELIQQAGGLRNISVEQGPDLDGSAVTAAELHSDQIATDPASHSSHDKETI